MSTTINTKTTTAKEIENLSGATNALTNNATKSVANAEIVVVAESNTFNGGAAEVLGEYEPDIAAENIILPVKPSSSPSSTCNSVSSWSDVLCANALCSSTQQHQQQQHCSTTYKEEEKEEETENVMENIMGYNEYDNVCLNKMETATAAAASAITTISSSSTILIPHLASSQSNLTTATALPTQQQLFLELQDTSAFDSGRESVNDCDSSLDDSINYPVAVALLAPSSSSLSLPLQQQRYKKPCTLDFYASTGSQSKWYLPSRDVLKINVQSDGDLMLTKSCVSIAEPESSVVTPPSDHGGNDGDGAVSQDEALTANDKM